MDPIYLAALSIGGLGLFFFGIKHVSTSLPVLGNWPVKKLVSHLTSNRLMSTASGFGLSLFVFSTTTTSLTIVSYVHSGILKLIHAFPALLGVQLGRAVLAWMFVLEEQRSLAYLLIGSGFFIYTIFRNERSYQWARLLFGLGIIFGGIQLTQEAIFPLRLFSEHSSDFFVFFTANSFTSRITIALIGFLLSLVLRSSLMAVGIAGVLSTIDVFPDGAVFVYLLGVGLASPLYVAFTARNAHHEARQSIFGVVFVNSLIFLVGMIFYNSLSYEVAVFLPEHTTGFVRVAIIQSLIAIPTLLAFPLVRPIEKLSERVIHSNGRKEVHHFEVVGSTLSLSPSLGIEQSEFEIKKLFAMVQAILDQTNSAVFSEDASQESFEKVVKYEKITDHINVEMESYLKQIMKLPLGDKDSETLIRNLRLSYELETVADCCRRIASVYKRTIDNKDDGVPDLLMTYRDQMSSITQFFEAVFSAVAQDKLEILETYDGQRQQLIEKSDHFREELTKYVNETGSDKEQAIYFDELRIVTDRLGSHTQNILEAYLV